MSWRVLHYWWRIQESAFNVLVFNYYRFKCGETLKFHLHLMKAVAFMSLKPIKFLRWCLNNQGHFRDIDTRRFEYVRYKFHPIILPPHCFLLYLLSHWFIFNLIINLCLPQPMLSIMSSFIDCTLFSKLNQEFSSKGKWYFEAFLYVISKEKPLL